MKTEKITTLSDPKGVVELYRITNAGGASVSLCNIGAGIVSVVVPDKHGELADVALGYRAPLDYFDDGPCMGKTPGRYANRIAKGRFTLAGREYMLPVNNGPNHLHGGPEGFANKVWDARVADGKIVFSLTSPDGDEGYPGKLKAEVAYSWSDANELRIEYSAMADEDTIVNLTNHAYFNLSGEDSGPVLGHKMKLYASRWLPTDETLVPTGDIAAVAGTPMDFTAPKTLQQDIGADFDALKFGKGYDNCWVLDGWKPGVLTKAAELSDPVSGRSLEVWTTQPGVQVYTGNWLAGSPESKSGRSYNDYDGVAIECQAFPDSPNKPAFPSVVLEKGREYRQTIEFRFS